MQLTFTSAGQNPFLGNVRTEGSVRQIGKRHGILTEKEAGHMQAPPLAPRMDE